LTFLLHNALQHASQFHLQTQIQKERLVYRDIIHVMILMEISDIRIRHSLIAQILLGFEHQCTGCCNLPFTGLTLIPSVQTYCTFVTEHCPIQKMLVDLNFERDW
jgi:hypothetical protein